MTDINKKKKPKKKTGYPKPKTYSFSRVAMSVKIALMQHNPRFGA